MLSILETLRYVRVTFPAFACVVKSVRQTKRTVSRERPLGGSHFGTVDDGPLAESCPPPRRQHPNLGHCLAKHLRGRLDLPVGHG
jgi:hypothetical protein